MRFAALLALALCARGADFYLHPNDVVVFYGDSITDQRLYTTYVETFGLTRYPKLPVRFVHSGWGGDRVRWDILAKAEGVEGRLARVQENPMLQALMGDRFHLRVHRETKEMPVYALVVERNKSKLKPPTGTEQSVRSGNGSFSVTKGRIAILATMLSRGLGRVVIDKTDLNGEYDYTLEWTPDPGEGGPESIGLPPEGPRPHVETNGPSIFTALQEQLGLRLVSQKGPVEIMVIDSVQRPSAN